MARLPGSHSSARPDRDARQRAWAAMRYLGRFRDTDIIAVAEIGARNLRAYRKRLAEAGYLRQVTARKSGYRMEDAIYELVRDTGPKHPIARARSPALYDQNNGETYGPQEPGHEHETGNRSERSGLAKRTA